MYKMHKALKWLRLIYNVVRISGCRNLWKLICAKFQRDIYPIDIPPMAVETKLDFLVIDIPARSSPMVPNGLGHVYNILKDTGVRFQLLDVNTIIYHRYHMMRILDKVDPVVTASGYVMKKDPWAPGNMEEWAKDEVLEYFWPQIDALLEDIALRKPKAVGMSIHANNRIMVGRSIRAIREKMPGLPVVVGGYDCVRRESGPFFVKDFDYMVIGEAELTLKPLVEALARGEKPRDLPGVIARWDSSDRVWEAPLLEDLDSIDYPKYEWTDLSLYRTFDSNAIAPITASRGCHWSRCRFCSECFTFRKRSPKSVVDEIEFLAYKGFIKIHFNESDINGDPENLYNICTEIIRRKPKVLLGGQIRIDRRNTKEYFEHLARAGILRLIFGVDGWNDRVLRFQMKGYNMKMVFQNLRDCRKAGIYTTVNIIIGVPGETEEDVDEMIENLTRCWGDINMIGSINTLCLSEGSEYYRNPDKYNIRFRGDMEEIYRNNPCLIPLDLWYSEEPYIDQEVRLKRLHRMFTELGRRGIKIIFTSSSIQELRGKKTVSPD